MFNPIEVKSMCNGCMPVRAVCKPHSPDLKRGALWTDARGCSLWRSLLERPPPAPESRVCDPLGELVRTCVGGVTHAFLFTIKKEEKFCRFALHNIRKIRPFLTQHAAQLVVQALVISRLDYCNSLLAGLPSNTIKTLQNAAARLVFSESKRAHVTPLFISLHWLPVAARIKFKTLMLAYRTATASAPAYFHSLITIYIPSRSLRSASECRLMVPSQRGTKSLSRTFSFPVPGWWN